MKVSFIIVAFNSENSIGTSLASLASQDYEHSKIEVILVDGMSRDKTKDLMMRFKESETSFNRTLVLDNPGRYLACGWNVALREVTGDIVLRMDAHTKFDKDFVSNNVRLQEKGEHICGGRVLSILDEDTPWNRMLLESENSMFGGGFTFFRRGETARYTNTLAFASYRKEVFDKVGTYNERLVRTEDNEMHYRMRKAGYRFYFDPSIYSYRYCRNSLQKLLRQKYLNGYWVGLTMAVAPKAFSVFYMVPFAFVLAIVACVALLPVSPLPLMALSAAYACVLLLSLFAAIGNKGFYPALLMLPAVIFLLHICYGIGTMAGLAKIPFWVKKGNGI